MCGIDENSATLTEECWILDASKEFLILICVVLMKMTYPQGDVELMKIML